LKSTLSQAPPTGLMTIGQLSNESGLPASTIRYWERVGVLPEPIRISGQRRYAHEMPQRLAVLRLAQACGFRLNEMRQLVQRFRSDLAPSGRWRKLARTKQMEIDQQIARLQAMRQVVQSAMRCKCQNWNECGQLAASVLERGRE
jgi:MerR family redox-sensitive transcriptional activator SoxR